MEELRNKLLAVTPADETLRGHIASAQVPEDIPKAVLQTHGMDKKDWPEWLYAVERIYVTHTSVEPEG